jgi:hypothetical protein
MLPGSAQDGDEVLAYLPTARISSFPQRMLKPVAQEVQTASPTK